MTTTENLHLPQWEADDRIMRTDFNNAMASIDAALAEKANSADLPAAIAAASPIVKLKDVTLTQAQTSVTLDFSDFDLTQYAEVKVCFVTSGAWYNIYVNNNRNSVYRGPHDSAAVSYLFYGGSNANSVLPAFLTITGMGTPILNATLLKGYGKGSYPDLAVSSMTNDSAMLTSLDFVVENTAYSFSAGCRFTVYGLKK